MAVYSYEQLKQLWIDAGGTPQTADAAARVALATSKGDSNFQRSNNDGTITRGLWGINSTHGKSASIDPMESARGAVALSQAGRDWDDWLSDWGEGVIKTAVTKVVNPAASTIGDLLGIDELPRLAYNVLLVFAGAVWMVGGLVLLIVGSRKFKGLVQFAGETVGSGVGFGVGAAATGALGGLGGGKPDPQPAPAGDPLSDSYQPRHEALPDGTRAPVRAEVVPTPLSRGARAHRQGDGGGPYVARRRFGSRLRRGIQWE